MTLTERMENIEIISLMEKYKDFCEQIGLSDNSITKRETVNKDEKIEKDNKI